MGLNKKIVVVCDGKNDGTQEMEMLKSFFILFNLTKNSLIFQPFTGCFFYG